MKNERQEKILKILGEKEFATVDYLANTLYVSMPTVRRDLTELAKSGLIRRSHGGAAIGDPRLALPFDFRTGSGRDVKLRMSRAAAALVSDGDTIFIDGSTSCMNIGEFLKDRQSITVVTNSAGLCARLLGHGFDIHCTGGKLIESSLCFAGSRAAAYAGQFMFDIMFFSSHAVSDAGIVTDYSQAENELRRYVMERSYKKVMLCDSSKFGKSSAYFTANMQSVDILITDAQPEFRCGELCIV